MENFRMKDFFEFSLDSLNLLSPNPEHLENLVNSIPDLIKMKNIYSVWMKCTDLFKKIE